MAVSAFYTTVVPRLTSIRTYDHFELRPAPAAKFCFDVWPELRVTTTTTTKKAGEKGGEFKLLAVGRRRGCFFVALSPQRSVSAIGGGFGLPGKVRCCFLLFKNCSGWVLQRGFGLGDGLMFLCCDGSCLWAMPPNIMVQDSLTAPVNL